MRFWGYKHTETYLLRNPYLSFRVGVLQRIFKIPERGHVDMVELH